MNASLYSCCLRFSKQEQTLYLGKPNNGNFRYVNRDFWDRNGIFWKLHCFRKMALESRRLHQNHWSWCHFAGKRMYYALMHSLIWLSSWFLEISDRKCCILSGPPGIICCRSVNHICWGHRHFLSNLLTMGPWLEPFFFAATQRDACHDGRHAMGAVVQLQCSCTGTPVGLQPVPCILNVFCCYPYPIFQQFFF